MTEIIYREVKREARPGDVVQLLDDCDFDDYHAGDVFTINNDEGFHDYAGTWRGLANKKHVVLERVSSAQRRRMSSVGDRITVKTADGPEPAIATTVYDGQVLEAQSTRSARFFTSLCYTDYETGAESADDIAAHLADRLADLETIIRSQQDDIALLDERTQPAKLAATLAEQFANYSERFARK